MLRTLEEHLHHCTELETNEEASVEFGVNRKSVLTQLQFFDLCSGALIPDIMHDVLEGVLQYEAKLVLAHVISGCRCIRLSHLNHLIESVELGYMETSSQPSPIILNMEDRHLRQNGMVYKYTPTSGFLSEGGWGGAFAPPPPPLGTGRFVNDNSSLMYG